MRPGIHPEYKKTLITCACGRVSETRATVDELHVEICSHCHPFFTGRQKLVDTAGRVERFRAKYGAGGGRAPAAVEEQEASEVTEPEAAIAVEGPELTEPEVAVAVEGAEAVEEAEASEPEPEAVEEAGASEPEAEAAAEMEAALDAGASEEEMAVDVAAPPDEGTEPDQADEAEAEKS